MHKIHYAGDSIVTGSEIARALLDYAQALSQVTASATVEVPTLEEDGERGRVELLIGPASQLIAHELRTDEADPVDDELVDRMTAEATRLRQFGWHTPTAGVVPIDSKQEWADLEEF
ncbi:MAG: hypothetical protein Q7T17_09225 [Microbacterium sp.]|uniref:hypothetical protein n=1 Tax=Microbacterium sp. TaxID=51671 RepID=UPI00271A73E5|nr:hypothetical protein [Microbacterium sp.]MDO8383145.1 hypothetical protein [Microbacterium sp.]